MLTSKRNKRQKKLTKLSMEGRFPPRKWHFPTPPDFNHPIGTT